MGRSQTRSGSGQVVRLPNARGVRAPGGRRWVWLTLLGSTLLVAVAVALTWRVQEVRVSGIDSLAADAIVAAAGVEGGEPMVLLRPRRVAERIERISGVRAADVERTAGGAVVLRIVERMPLVRLDVDHSLGADADGRLFEVPPDQPLPLLGGWRGTPEAGRVLDARTRLILSEYARFPAELRAATLTVVSGERLLLILADGLEIRFGVLQDLEPKARAAASVLQIAAERGETLEYVDVRTPTSPVAKHPGEPEPDPSPDPAAADDGD